MDIPEFSKEDIDFLDNADPLIQKRTLQDRIYDLLSTTRESIKTELPEDILSKFETDKISRGENYKSLPYLILDYPARFNDDDTLACRTMFLWGKFFSTTIHLQGKSLDLNRELLPGILENINQQNLYVSSGPTPWQYHYQPENYLPLTGVGLSESLNQDFFKLSVRLSIDEYRSLPEKAVNFYKTVLTGLEINF